MAGNKPNYPADSARLVLWHVGLEQPTIIVVERKVAERVMHVFQEGSATNISFLSYPDGSGLRSEAFFRMSALRGVMMEYPTVQLATSLPN